MRSIRPAGAMSSSVTISSPAPPPLSPMAASAISASPFTAILRPSKRSSTAATSGPSARFNTTTSTSRTRPEPAACNWPPPKASPSLSWSRSWAAASPIRLPTSAKPWTAFPLQRSPAKWALDWLWNQPEVTVVLSGMSTMHQVEENLRFASAASHRRLHSRRARPARRCPRKIPARAPSSHAPAVATACPVPPASIFPLNFEFFNYAHAFDDCPAPASAIKAFLTEAQRSGACINCGTCEPLCPQHIPIAEWMPKISALLA